MRMFDVQGIEIFATREKVFNFVRAAGSLPQWAHAFASAEDGRARLQTPAGTVDVGLEVAADAATGTVDWRLTFPDGGVGLAQSRVTETKRGTCIYSFGTARAAGGARTDRGRTRGAARPSAIRARDAEVLNGAVMIQPVVLEDVARRAIDGDRDALDDLVKGLQGDVYGLALRMLWNREDAEDATQEILVRIVTRLAQFDFRSQLKTWVYKVAVNYILDLKKSPVERMNLTFERFADDLADGLSSDGPADAERSALTEEVKIGCTLGMLQCLDRPHRLAYVFGEILELPGPEAADAIGITAALFRKRLQHARAAIVSFTRTYCGLASDAAACACNRRVPAALRVGRIREDALDFASKASSYQEARSLIRQVEEARWVLAIHRSSQPRASSVDFARRLAQAIDSGKTQ